METRTEQPQPSVLAAHDLVAVHDLAMRLAARPQTDGPTVAFRPRGLIRRDVDSNWMVFNASRHLDRNSRLRLVGAHGTAWVPDALLCNTGLRWGSGGPKRLIVGAGTRDKAVKIALDLDKHGRMESANAVERSRAVSDRFSPTQWRVRFATSTSIKVARSHSRQKRDE